MNLYHYCSNATMISILSNREIWASEFSLSNDRMEGKWIREIFAQCCDESGVSASDQNKLIQRLDMIIALSAGAGFCMSEEGDLLSQWRAYADNGGGVSIGFTKDYFNELGELKRDRNDEFNASLTKIEYDVAKQKNLLAEHLDEILKFVAEGALKHPLFMASSDEEQKAWRQKFMAMGIRFLFFFIHVYSLKNPAFAEEREWRIISYVLRAINKGGVDQLRKMDFRALGDRIVPFTRINLEPLTHDSITEIVLGPRNITPEEFVRGLLDKYGWASVTVRRSCASYR